MLAAALGACTPPADRVLEGRPAGPYRLTLALAPAPVEPAVEIWLSWRLTHTDSGAPVTDLVLHLGSEVHVAI